VTATLAPPRSGSTETDAPAGLEPRYGAAALAGAAVIAGCYTRTFDIVGTRLGLPSLFAPASIAVIIALAWTGARRLRARAGSLIPVTALAFIHIWMSLITVLWAGDRDVALEVSRVALFDAALMIMVAVLIVDSDTLRLATFAVVAGGAGMATLSVFQYLTGSFNQTFFGFATAPLDNVIGSVDSNRIAGPLGDPNFFAQLLAVAAVMAAHLARHARTWRQAVVLWGAAAMCATGVVFSFSRGGLFSLVIGSALLVLLEPIPLHRVVGAGVAVFLIVVLIIPAGLTSRLGELKQLLPGQESTSQSIANDPALVGRQSEALVALHQFEKHPFLGVGAGNYKVEYLQYAAKLGTDLRGVDRSAHSLYLETAAEEGIVGLLALLGVICWALGTLRSARRRLLKLGDTEGASVTRTVLLGLVTYLCGGLFLHSAFPIMLWMLLAIAIAGGRIQATRPTRRYGARLQPAEPFEAATR
jgi:O-antigen ligase